MSKEKYRELTPEMVDTLKYNAARELKVIHDFKPDYVLLNDAGAVPEGYIFKEAWKQAFPEEPMPRFYRVDPRALAPFSQRGGDDDVERRRPLVEKVSKNETYRKKVESYLKKRIKRKDARVMILDEESHSGKSIDYVRHMLIENGIDSKNIESRGWFVHEGSGAKNDTLYGARPTKKDSRYFTAEDIAGRSMTAKIRKAKSGTKRDKGLSYDVDISLNIRDYIHDMKLLGREAGEQLRAQIKAQSELENKVTSSIAIGGLALSLIFLSPNLTSNAISTLTSHTSNLLGAGLFIIGLLGVFFRLRKK